MMPVERPTVPKALVISKSASINVISGSIHKSRYVAVMTMESAKMVMTDAFLKAFLGMAYRKAFSDLLVAADLMPWIKTKNVLVLIPPPVEPGEAPMNIRMMTANNPALEKEPMG